jgi:hypothetical protein
MWSACTTSAGGGPSFARPLRKGGNHTDRTMGFAFHAAVSALRYRHPFQSCHPERNFVIGKANDKVESKDPYVCQHRPRQRKAFSPRRNRPGGPFLAAPSQGVGTTLIAQWALPFTPRVPQMSMRKTR